MAKNKYVYLFSSLKFFQRVRDEISVVFKYVLSRMSYKGKSSFYLFRRLNLPLWYHDFVALGIKTQTFRDVSCKLSQQDKEPILFNFIERGSNIIKEKALTNGSPISLVDLFCADAYYSLYALHRRFVDSAVGIDLEEGSGEGFIRGGVLDQADTISKICQLEGKLELKKGDVFEYEGTFDICLCIGGLYHISDPLTLLGRMSAQTRHVLVIQTVIPSNIGEDSSFFVTPAPHWTWGSRFNKKFIVDALATLGWSVLDADVRPMRANTHDWDKLSLSLICVKN